MQDVPGAVAAYLKHHNLPTSIRTVPHADVADMPWQAETLLDVDSGPAVGGDEVGVGRAFGGVAETGTLVMVSGADTPTMVNVLPRNNIVVVRRSEIAATYEDVWAKLRVATGSMPGATRLPRSVNWITGPSRTADIEQTLLLGAHGPQRLHIVIVEDGDRDDGGAG